MHLTQLQGLALVFPSLLIAANFAPVLAGSPFAPVASRTAQTSIWTDSHQLVTGNVCGLNDEQEAQP